MKNQQANPNFANLGQQVGDDFRFDDYLSGLIGSPETGAKLDSLSQGMSPMPSFTGPKNGEDPNQLYPASPAPLVGPGAY